MTYFECLGEIWEGESKCSACKPLVVIDPEDRDAVERLYRTYVTTAAVNRVDALWAALREFANPKPPKRVWTDGDVVRGYDYAAIRDDGGWHTTSTGGRNWADDEYVTIHVESGGLTVLREQAAE